VLATVDDITGGTIFLSRKFAPPHLTTTVELTQAQFDKLSVAVGNVMDHTINGNHDLVALEDVSDATILHTLRLRIEKKMIFTAIGPVLVVVNPYQPVPACSPDALKKLTTDLLKSDYAGGGLEALLLEQPHCHKTVAAAYSDLKSNMRGGGAQSILVSGESGAGKTETTKICMNCLAALSQSSGGITDAALESSFLLEAIGNAKTVYNNNSSRFGKWMAVHFDKGNKILACKIRSYLLEQSRIVGPGPGERSYHIFYYLLKGKSAEESKQFALSGGCDDYNFVKTGDKDAQGSDDVACWKEMKDKLKTLGLNADEMTSLLGCVATTLNMGQVEFKEKGGDVWECANPEQLEICAQQLQVPKEMLAAKLVTRSMTTGRGSTYTINLNGDQCADGRDALAKGVYSAMFDWVIKKLNVTLDGNKVPESDLRFIGFLDIFGFENFEFNTFEQLCINFTNERLQSHFMDALIKKQQEEYKREGVSCAHITFPDNTLQIQLIDSNKGSVFSMLDEEVLVPKGSDLQYVAKMITAFGKPNKVSAIFIKPRIGKNGDKIKGKPITDKSVAKFAELSFVITHYAGEVLYTAENWLEKNRGALHPDLVQLLATSSQPLISELFDKEIEKKQTVGYAYHASLRALSDTMAATQPALHPLPQAQHGQEGRALPRRRAHAPAQVHRLRGRRRDQALGLPGLDDDQGLHRLVPHHLLRPAQADRQRAAQRRDRKNLLTFGQAQSEEKDEPGWLDEKGGFRVQGVGGVKCVFYFTIIQDWKRFGRGCCSRFVRWLHPSSASCLFEQPAWFSAKRRRPLLVRHCPYRQPATRQTTRVGHAHSTSLHRRSEPGRLTCIDHRPLARARHSRAALSAPGQVPT